MTADPIAAFAFTAQSSVGEPISGTINAASVAEASKTLNNLQLRVIELDPQQTPAAKTKKLSGDDFQAFNIQLAYLATAGLPIEKSLRLIAQDMRSGALARTVKQVATDMESGRSLPEAFAQHAAQFPPLYSELVNAGIHTNNLSGMLLGLGRHLELNRRLRNMLWQAVSYPMIVLLSLIMVISYLSIFVFPQFKIIFTNFRVELPVITQMVIALSDFLTSNWPILLGVLIAVIIGPPIIFHSLKSPVIRQRMLEIFVFPLPLIGLTLQRNLLARWCDALKLGVEAGLDLPAAITLAGQAVGSPRLMKDGAILVETINSGRPLDASVQPRLLPATVVTVLGSSSGNNDLPGALNTLGMMFQQQAEMKMAMIPTLLTPVLILMLAVLIAFTVIAMFAPMISLITSVSGPQKL